MVSVETVLETALALLESGEDITGVCISCGEEQYGVEPDARGYTCEGCGAPKVYGAEEIVMTHGGY